MQTQVAAASSGIELTHAGLAYCARFGRPAIERRIERHLALVTALLTFLDDADGDPDLEPSLGLDPLGSQDLEADLDNCMNTVDGKILDGLELDSADDEPSLGWTDMESRFGRLAAPTFDPDREDEHDGAEPDDEADELDTREAGEEEIRGELDWSEYDSGERIPGGGSGPL